MNYTTREGHSTFGRNITLIGNGQKTLFFKAFCRGRR
jgi:hypothetical protein